MGAHWKSRLPSILLSSFAAFICIGGEQRGWAAGDEASAENAAIPERDATVFGFKLHYREAGKGPVVILLHGLGGDGSRWAPTMDVLAGDFRVIALDQIGFGESDKPLANYNHGMLAEFLVEFIKTIGIEKASLVGHSMGAFVAMYTAVHHPEAVDRLALVDGGGLVNAPRSPHLVQIQNGTTLAETREYFELMFYDKSRVTDEMVQENFMRRLRVSYTISKMQEARAKGLATISEEEARGIRAPTLILWGKHDELLDPSDAAVLDRVIPNSRAVLIEESGHIPQVEQPQQFNQLVRDFLTGDDAGATSSND
ncbi:MAG: alpha/beta fold hydrolase [Pirellulales bacterium]